MDKTGRGRPPSTQKPPLFPGGNTIVKKKRSSSQSSMVRRLGMSKIGTAGQNAGGLADRNTPPDSPTAGSNADGVQLVSEAGGVRGKMPFSKHWEKARLRFAGARDADALLLAKEARLAGYDKSKPALGNGQPAITGPLSSDASLKRSSPPLQPSPMPTSQLQPRPFFLLPGQLSLRETGPTFAPAAILPGVPASPANDKLKNDVGEKDIYAVRNHLDGRTESNDGKANIIDSESDEIIVSDNVSASPSKPQYTQQQQEQQEQQVNQEQLQQQQLQLSQSPMPCDACTVYYEEALAQSHASLYAFSSRLAAVNQQIADQVALLYERDAEIAQKNAAIQRLRASIQEQLAQLEATPAGIPGLSHNGIGGGGGVGFLPDGQIRARWNGLHMHIRQFAEVRVASLIAAIAAASSLPSALSSSLPTPPLLSSLSIPHDCALFLHRLSPDYEKFLQSRAGSLRLIETAIWAVLADNVFSRRQKSSRMCWAGPWSASLANISMWRSFMRGWVATDNTSLSGHKAESAFHLWRAQTAVFIRSLETDDTEHNAYRQDEEVTAALARKHSASLVQALEARISPLLIPENKNKSKKRSKTTVDTKSSPDENPPAVPADLHQEFFDLAVQAISLDMDLCQQRAWFYVHYPLSDSGNQYGMAFDERAMELLNSSGRDISVGDSTAGPGSASSAGGGAGGISTIEVSLVIRPALFKAGDSRGENYEHVQCVEPSLVCRAPSRNLLRQQGGRGQDNRSKDRS